MTDDLITTAREIARQAAREAVARRYDTPAWQDIADEIRDGRCDDERLLAAALAGADAAVSAALPVIVRAAADVAEAVAVDIEQKAIACAEAAPGHSAELHNMANNGVRRAKRAILALTPETTP